MPSPEADVAAQLAGLTQGSTILVQPPGAGQNLFSGPERAVDPPAVPALAVFCCATGGEAPIPLMGESADVRRSSVQVLVRSEQTSRAPALDLARACLARLQRASISGYIGPLVASSEPTILGEDQQGLFRWTFTVRMWWRG